MITCYLENGDKIGLRHATVALIIVKDNKVLLCKRGFFNGKPILESGKWALIGGFIDRDETIVGAAKREAVEETGWKVDNLRLFRINDDPERPNDAERQNLSFAFIADAVSHKVSNTEEVTDLEWFDIDNLPPKEKIAFDFYDDLRLYKKYLKKKFPIPFLG